MTLPYPFGNRLPFLLFLYYSITGCLKSKKVYHFSTYILKVLWICIMDIQSDLIRIQKMYGHMRKVVIKYYL